MVQKTDAGWTPLRKTGLHRWACIPTEGPVEVQFHFTAAQLNAGSTWADDRLLYVNPVNCLPYHDDLAEHPVEVQLPDVPHHWAIATALPHMSDSQNGVFLMANGTQELMDSPWIAAPKEDLWHGEYEIGGHPFHIHVWGRRHYDDAAFVEAHRKFTESQMAAFGWLPVPQYHFLYLSSRIFPRDTAWSTKASTVITWGRFRPAHPHRWRGFRGLEEVIDIASHELVHTWNVKRLRPAEWMPYDFLRRQSQPHGLCRRRRHDLGDLFLLEAGVIEMEGWLRRFEKLLTRHLWNPGRLQTSVADSSFDTWLDGYAIGVPHRRGNIYVEGAVLAFLCDVALNRAGGGWLVDALAELAGPDRPRALTEERWWATLERRAAQRGPEGAVEMRQLRADFCEGTEDTWPDLVDAMMHQGIEATLEPHSEALARCGALCGQREGRTEVKVCWRTARHGTLDCGAVTSSNPQRRKANRWPCCGSATPSMNPRQLPCLPDPDIFARPRLGMFPADLSRRVHRRGRSDQVGPHLQGPATHRF